MRAISATEASLLASGSYAIRYRFWIRNHLGADIEYTDWAQSLSWDEDIDTPVAGLSAELLFRDGAVNLSPLVGGANPAIDVGRECRLEVGYAAVGGLPATWHNVFQGVLDRVDPNGYNSLRLEARDLGGRLMDAFVEEEREYGSAAGIAMETVMQTILNDWGAGVVLHVPTSPAAMIGAYRQSKKPVLDALRELALQIGWTVGFRWEAGAWRLTLADPNRAITVPMYTLGPDLYLTLSKCAIDRSSVRNVIRGVAGPATARITSVVSDAASIARFGRGYMELVEADDSIIDTLPELNRFINAALADLRDPKSEIEIALHLFPWAQLNDYYEFSPNAVHFDSAQRLAVISIQHRIDKGHLRTTLMLRGQPAGAYNNWLGGDGGRPGGPPPNETDPLPAPGGFVSTFTGPDALFGWNPVAGAEFYRVEVMTGGILRRTDVVTDPRYVYTFAMNRSDGAGTAWPTVQILVRAVLPHGLASTAGSHTATNLAPAAPSSIAMVGEPLRFVVSVPEPTFPDYMRTEWQADDNAGFTSPTAAASGPDWRGIAIGLESTTGNTWVRARFLDVFFQVSDWTSANTAGVLVGAAHIAAQAVGVAQFAANLAPPQLFNAATLPTLPNAAFPQGTILYNAHATNHGLWQNKNNTTWTRLVDGGTDIIANSIIAGMIQAGAIGATQLAARSVTAHKLAIADYTNIITNDPSATGDLAGWLGVDGVVNDTTMGRPWIMRLRDRDTYWPASGEPPIPIEAGRAYFFSLIVRTEGALASNHPLRIGWQLLDRASAHLSWFSAASRTPPSAAFEISGILTAPANAAFARFWIQIDKPHGAELDRPWFVANPIWRRANAGELIVDGSITATKMTALDLAALAGTFGGGPNRAGIDSRGLRVHDGANNMRVATGNISGLPWGSTTTPANTWGFYGGPGANVFLTDYPRLLAVVPFNQTFPLDTIPAGQARTLSVFTPFNLGGPRIIAYGRRLMAMASNIDEFFSSAFYRYRMNIRLFGALGTGWVRIENYIAPAGGYSLQHIELRSFIGLQNNTTGSQSTSGTQWIGQILIMEGP